MPLNITKFELMLMIIAGLLAGALVADNFAPSQITITQLPPKSGTHSVSIFVPAVDEQGNGIATKLIVTAYPGNGKILADINKLLFFVDTQQSIQTATTVAARQAGADLQNWDLSYTVETDNATVVGGPSAGASIAIATIAVLEGKLVRDDVMMTGTINPDGTIGPVGAIAEKAEAARSVNSTLLLVPPGEGTETRLIPNETCVQEPDHVFCETNYRKNTSDLSEELKINIKEVGTIAEALPYFVA